MRKLAKVVLVILLLPVVGLASLYLIGLGMTRYMEMQQESVRAEQEEISSAGNGFGGDPGMVVVDSGYYAEQFYWLDNDHLVLNKKWIANTDKNEGAVYVWNVVKNEIKPVDLYGRLHCVDNEDIYFYDGGLVARAQSDPALHDNIFRGQLEEGALTWSIKSRQSVSTLLVPPSSKFELRWGLECQPHFGLKKDYRVESNSENYRFRILDAWDWIVRFPLIGSQESDYRLPEMGFFSLGDELYSGQRGEKVAELIDRTPKDLTVTAFRYIDFIDSYWLAIPNSGERRDKWMGFIYADGHYEAHAWPSNWLSYSDLPLPTRKGLLWSGYDYRIIDRGFADLGVYLQDSKGNIAKVMGGTRGLRQRMSKDGCRVAFYSSPTQRMTGITLKYFNACQSTIGEKEFEDVDYRLRESHYSGSGLPRGL